MAVVGNAETLRTKWPLSDMSMWRADSQCRKPQRTPEGSRAGGKARIQAVPNRSARGGELDQQGGVVLRARGRRDRVRPSAQGHRVLKRAELLEVLSLFIAGVAITFVLAGLFA